MVVKVKIFVGAILRCCLSEDGKYIKPIKNSLEPLTPNSDLTTRIIRYLSSENILIPSSESELEAFVFDEEHKPSRYYTYEVRYLLNIEPKDKYSLLIERLMYPKIENYGELLDIWRELALHECLAYLLFQMEEVGYNFSVGATTISTIDKLLETFSVGQIHTLIFRAVANSTRAYQSGNYSKSHAMNIVISSCRNLGERAIAEKWDLKAYNRIKQLPESELSRLLFTVILKKPNQGFYLAPTMSNLQYLISEE